MTENPCDWPLLRLPCEDEEDSFWDTLPEEIKAAASRTAVELLWNWTGQKYGLCEVSLRPSRCGPSGTTYHGTLPSLRPSAWSPALIGGQWFNLSCGSCAGLCSCSEPSSLILPGPVESVSGLVIDGVPVPLENVSVYNRSTVVRTDGGGFPCGNDLSSPVGQDGTWEITYLRGNPVPTAGQIAAGVLAEEFAKALCGDDSCKLPSNATQVNRQGVSISLEYSPELIELGVTGLFEVDSWVQSVNLPRRRMTGYNPRKYAALRNARRTS